MAGRVVRAGDSWEVVGAVPLADLGNRFLSHLASRGFSAATVRGYAFDLVVFASFLEERRIGVADVRGSDLFDWLDWQQRRGPGGSNVVRLGARGPAASTLNRRVAAVRGLFEYAVIVGVVSVNPVPAGRRSSGLRPAGSGMLSHVGGRRPSKGGRLVRDARRLPEAVDVDEVSVFLADLDTARDRAIVLLMLLGGLRAAEVRSLRLADVDMGLHRVRVMGKGRRERVVPVDAAFFTELAAYLRDERSAGLATPACFVVLRGPTAGQAMTEAGMRKIFRVHRERSGATRVRPHRLRHTYGTELAAAGIDLLVLRQLMGHASPDTTAGYVHLAPETLAGEYARARRTAQR